MFLCSFGLGSVSMGLLPPPALLPSLPTFSALETVTVPASLSISQPSLLSNQHLGVGSGLARVPAGCQLGEGLLPVPENLVKKINKFDFVEMHELLLETWLREDDENVLGLPRRKSITVTNILQWVQCFSAMVGVLSLTYIVPADGSTTISMEAKTCWRNS